MRFLLILCLLFLLAQISLAQDGSFHDVVLNDITLAGSSNFIALEIDSSSHKGRAVIENRDLYVFLKKQKKLDEAAYKTFMKNLLANKKKLCVGNIEVEESDFKLVREIEEVNEYAAKGKKEFLNHYFDGKFMKAEIIQNAKSFDPMYAVADKLFEWGIATYVDDISGILAIWDYENLK